MLSRRSLLAGLLGTPALASQVRFAEPTRSVIAGTPDFFQWQDFISTRLSGYECGVVPPGCTRITAGISPTKFALWWVKRAWRPDGSGATIDYGVHSVRYVERGDDVGLYDALEASLRDVVDRLAIDPPDIAIDSSWRPDLLTALTGNNSPGDFRVRESCIPHEHRLWKDGRMKLWHSRGIEARLMHRTYAEQITSYYSAADLRDPQRLIRRSHRSHWLDASILATPKLPF